MESSNHDKDEILRAQELMSSLGGKIIVVPYYESQSSTKIKNEIIRRNLKCLKKD